MDTASLGCASASDDAKGVVAVFDFLPKGVGRGRGGALHDGMGMTSPNCISKKEKTFVMDSTGQEAKEEHR